MRKPIFFNLKITLNCITCKKEVFMNDPWESISKNEGIVLTDFINEAYTLHKASYECKNPRGEATINGKQYWITEKP